MQGPRELEQHFRHQVRRRCFGFGPHGYRAKEDLKRSVTSAPRANSSRQLWHDAPILPSILVGAPGFEPGTPSPPDWCANRAALRSAEKNHVYAAAAQRARARMARAPKRVSVTRAPAAAERVNEEREER